MPASISFQVRDAIITRIKVMPFFTGTPTPFTFTSNKALPIQPQSLPLCGVYFINESGRPDGDANAGEPRFKTSVRYGFSVVILNNDPEAAEYTLDLAYLALTGGLFSDPTLYNNANFQIEGYELGTRSHSFGNAGLEQELPFVELRWELVCNLGTIDYPPLVLDNLDLIRIKTAFPLGGTEYEQAGTPQVEAVYDLPQN
jgi:hypothetical protein